jgi:hypothetical protein
VGAIALLIHPGCAIDYQKLSYGTVSTTPTPEPTGLLDINSYPIGADIYLNGIYKGTTPNYISVTPGSYTIKLTKTGYNDYSTTITSSESGVFYHPRIYAVLNPLYTPTPTLSPTGILNIDSNPTGADIYIDRSYIGEMTPETISLAPGDHEITLQKLDYNVYSEHVTIKTDPIRGPLPISIDVDLIPKYPSFLNVSSSPSGADIYIEGVYQGITPKNITINRGSYRVKLMKKGYFDYSTLTSITHGVQSSVIADLVSATLFVSSSPSGADVYIDGSYQGLTPINISDLALGFHTVRVAKSEYNTYSTSVIISENNTTTITAYLSQKNDVKIHATTITSHPTDTPILTPQPSSKETTNITESTTKTALLIPSVIAGIMIAGILLVKRRKGF